MVLLHEPVDQLAPLGRIREELSAATDGHAADRVGLSAGLGDHAYPRVTAQVVDLRQAVHADHRQPGRVVQEPHGHGDRRPVGLHGGQNDDLLGVEELLDARVSQRRHGLSITLMARSCFWSKMAYPCGASFRGIVWVMIRAGVSLPRCTSGSSVVM